MREGLLQGPAAPLAVRSRRPHPLFRRLLLGRARCRPGEELDHGLADTVEVGAERPKHLRGDAFAFLDQAEQDMLGPDVVVSQLVRLAKRQLEDLLRAWRERDVAGDLALAPTDDLFDLLAGRLHRDVERLEDLPATPSPSWINPSRMCSVPM